jgi:cytoskeleton protein RodZ
MFEIGSSLREARERQSIDLAKVEAATRIRGRYLEALEREQFDLLPEGPYRRSFLREYAEFLGLDGDTYVAEYESRFAPHTREAMVAPRPERAAPPAGAGPLRPLPLAVAILAVALIGVAVWRLGTSGGGHKPGAAATTTPPVHTTTRRAAPPPTTTAAAPARPAVLVLRATRGSCWLAARIGSSAGRVAYEGTLLQGQSIRLGVRKALWIRVGAPWNLDATLAGRSATADLPARTGDMLVTASGLRATRT